MFVVNSQPEVCEVLIWLRAHFYIKHLISIVCQIIIDIEHLEVYVHKKKMDLKIHSLDV